MSSPIAGDVLYARGGLRLRRALLNPGFSKSLTELVRLVLKRITNAAEFLLA
jgi:hypothetical protein